MHNLDNCHRQVRLFCFFMLLKIELDVNRVASKWINSRFLSTSLLTILTYSSSKHATFWNGFYHGMKFMHQTNWTWVLPAATIFDQTHTHTHAPAIHRSNLIFILSDLIDVNMLNGIEHNFCENLGGKRAIVTLNVFSERLNARGKHRALFRFDLTFNPLLIYS